MINVMLKTDKIKIIMNKFKQEDTFKNKIKKFLYTQIDN
jgi:hypothetical protein